MKKQINSIIDAQLPRGACYLLLLLAVCAIPFALAQQRSILTGKASHPAALGLTFAERVAYQTAIENVYWRHRIWPDTNPGPKPGLDKVMSQAQIEKKVTDYLRNSQALEDYWQRPITSQQLQAEMDRMATHTKQPEVLQELFEALGNDPFVIAECLARPALADRLLTSWYSYDQRIHGELRRRAEADLQAHPTVDGMKQTSGGYSEIELVKSDSSRGEANRGLGHGATVNSGEWNETVQKLAAMFGNGDPVAAGVSPAQPTRLPPQKPQIKTGVLSPLQEDDGHYYAVAVMKKGKDRLKLATIAWLKEPLQLWLAKAEMQAPVTMAAVSANYTLPLIASPSVACTDDTWTGTSVTNAPAARDNHTAVWTGSEMIVWGGYDGTNYFNTGGKYNPSTNSWTATSSTNAPSARAYHTAVWTGSEMIVWGGYDGNNYVNTGGKYNPSTNSWTATSSTNAPSARAYHTAV